MLGSMGIPPEVLGDPIEMLKSVLPKTVNIKITFAVVADPEDPKKHAFAIILRENK